MKRGFTLIELVITLALTSLLLSVLFEGYRHLPASQKKTQEATFAVLSLQKVDSLLSSIFSRLNTEGFHTDLFEKESNALALFFSFTGGIDPDPAFSGPIQGALYLSKTGEFYLTSWGKEDTIRTDLLLENLETVSFLFFDPEEKKWISDWSSKKKGPPPFCQMSFTSKKKKEQTLSFALPTTLEISYTK